MIVSEIKLNPDSFTPYIEITFQTKLALDQSMFQTIAGYNESILNIMAAEYELALEKELKPQLMEKVTWIKKYL